MNKYFLPPFHSTAKSPAARLPRTFTTVISFVAHAFATFWTGRGKMLRERRAYDALTGLDQRTLQDIGAPEWLLADAIEQSPAELLRRADQWRG
jgi:hypothetical protein